MYECGYGISQNMPDPAFGEEYFLNPIITYSKYI
jgi:hypothetical protein